MNKLNRYKAARITEFGYNSWFASTTLAQTSLRTCFI